MNYNFPKICYADTNNNFQQALHAVSEAEEVVKTRNTAELDMEMADLMHSCETYFRIRERDGADVDAIFAEVVEKNTVRDYYK